MTEQGTVGGGCPHCGLYHYGPCKEQIWKSADSNTYEYTTKQIHECSLEELIAEIMIRLKKGGYL